MNRWSARAMPLAMLAALAGALALRAPQLAVRPLHNDEAVNAVKVSDLWEEGRYAYDPDEYHGPSLHYASLPFLWLAGARTSDDLDDATLRLVTVAFGAGLVLLTFLFADGLGRSATFWAAVFTAISPAMVFYSRYFIHEMLLVFFSALTLGAAWRYVQSSHEPLRRSPLRPASSGGRAEGGSYPAAAAGLEPGEVEPSAVHGPVSTSSELGKASHEPSPGEGTGPTGCMPSPPTRRSARFMAPIRESEIVEPSHEPSPGEGTGPTGCMPSPPTRRSAIWAVMAGLGVGLMWITKETFVFALAAMGIAIVACAMNRNLGQTLRALRTRKNWNAWHLFGAGVAALVVWFLFFSSFFTNPAGLADSVRTYLPWLNRAGGHSPHIHPWSFYFQRLAWFHPAKGPTFSEVLILVLAVVGAIASLIGKQRQLGRFLTFYTLVLTGIYCVIPYKTPWCLLGFFHGMILLAGIGAAALVEWNPSRAPRLVIGSVLLAATGQLAWQAWQAGVVYASDRRNPYVYAQTSPDLANLLKRCEGLARVAPEGHEMIIKTIVADGDYWPLPWSLRRFKNVGWYETLPDDPFAPVIIVSSRLNARLDERSGKKWIMAGITELRPGKFLELYVEFELWKRYVEKLPRVVD